MENNRAYRQINWDEMYLANEKANALNEDALYYQEERHNDQLAFNFSSILTITSTRIIATQEVLLSMQPKVCIIN